MDESTWQTIAKWALGAWAGLITLGAKALHGELKSRASKDELKAALDAHSEQDTQRFEQVMASIQRIEEAATKRGHAMRTDWQAMTNIQTALNLEIKEKLGELRGELRTAVEGMAEAKRQAGQ